MLWTQPLTFQHLLSAWLVGTTFGQILFILNTQNLLLAIIVVLISTSNFFSKNIKKSFPLHKI